MSACLAIVKSWSNFNLRLAGLTMFNDLAFHETTVWLKALSPRQLLVGRRGGGSGFNVDVHRVKALLLRIDVVPNQNGGTVASGAGNLSDEFPVAPDTDEIIGAPVKVGLELRKESFDNPFGNNFLALSPKVLVLVKVDGDSGMGGKFPPFAITPESRGCLNSSSYSSGFIRMVGSKNESLTLSGALN